MHESLPPRITSKIILGSVPPGLPDPCWIWTASTQNKGYGQVRWNGTTRLAHRVVYELVNGHEPPAGRDLDHLCRTITCVNPAHLDPVDHRENCLRGVSANAINARRTHCENGHEFTPDNIKWSTNGHRRCRTCNNAWQREWKRAKVARIRAGKLGLEEPSDS